MSEKPIMFSGPMVRAILDGRKTQTRRVIKPQPDREIVNGSCKCISGPPPIYEPGMRLWVRETFSPQLQLNAKAYFRATDRLVGVSKWKPAIFMPRALSRITLEITGLRIERVQEISCFDALAEGIEKNPHVPSDECNGKMPEVCLFREIWDSINAKRGFGWQTNPWVWVIEFKRV